jgi:hypothetical protein
MPAAARAGLSTAARAETAQMATPYIREKAAAAAAEMMRAQAVPAATAAYPAAEEAAAVPERLSAAMAARAVAASVASTLTDRAVRFVIINQTTQTVVNAVEWSGDTAIWSPPAGHFALRRDDGNPGDHFDGRDFVSPPVIPDRQSVLVETLDALIASPAVTPKQIAQALRDFYGS